MKIFGSLFSFGRRSGLPVKMNDAVLSPILIDLRTREGSNCQDIFCIIRHILFVVETTPELFDTKMGIGPIGWFNPFAQQPRQ